MNSIENWINEIVMAYPWASEETLKIAYGEQSSANLKARQAIAKIRNDPASWDSVVDEIKKNADRGSTFNRYSKHLSTTTSSIIKTMARDDSINAINELAYNMAKGLDGVANAADELTDSARWLSLASNNRYAKLIRAVETGVDGLNLGTNAVIGTVAIGGIALKFVQDQEKALRTMIDFGILSNDLTVFNQIRDNAGLLGMTQQDFIKEFSDFGPVFANMTNDAADGYQKFTNMALVMKQADGFSTYGLMLRDYAKEIASNTQLLYRLNQISAFNEETKMQVAQTFETNSIFSLTMANRTGQKRDELLKARTDALGTIELTAALDRNYAQIIDMFGDDGAKNITENIGFLSMLMTPLPEDFRKESTDILTRAVYDIDFDGGNILNNMSNDMLKMLTAMGPQVKNQYIEMMQTIVQAGYDASDPGQLTNDYIDLMTAMRDSDTVDISYLDVAPEQVNARMIQDIITTIPESAFERNLAITNFTKTTIDTAVTIASEAVQAISDIGVFTATVKAKILPEYDTTAGAINVFGVGLEFLQNSMSALNLSGRKDEVIDLDSEAAQSEERQKLTEARQAMLAELQTVTTVEQFNAVLDSHDLPGMVGGSIDMPASDISHLFTGEQTVDSSGRPQASADVVAARMIEALSEYGITDQRAQANILGMVSGESGFQLLEETSYRNTSISRIREVLASRAQFYTDQEIELLKADDRAFYDAMYGEEQEHRRQVARDNGLSRQDNGGSISANFVRSGNLGGYDYRGRGYIQLTGIENYRRIGEIAGVDLVNNPDLVNDPYWAPRIAAAYYGNMSETNRAKLVDSREVYRLTWGAYPDTASKVSDAQMRAGVAAGFLQRIESGQMQEIDTSLSDEEQAYISERDNTGQINEDMPQLSEMHMPPSQRPGRQAGETTVLADSTSITEPINTSNEVNDSTTNASDYASVISNDPSVDIEISAAISEIRNILASSAQRQVT